MKNLLYSIFILTVPFTLLSQTQGVAYTAVGRGVATTFVTDYQALGINSSALGWGNKYEKKFTTGMTEFNFGIYSDSLDATKLRRLYRTIYADVSGKETEPADWDQQRQYAQEYLESGVAIDANYNWFGFSFFDEKVGGIAFSINEQYNWYSRFNKETTDLVFGGKLANYFDSLMVVFGSDTTMIANSATLSNDTLENVVLGTISVPLKLSEITNGSSIRFVWNRNYNIGYGRKLFGADTTFALYAGVGARFIQSMGMIDMESDGSKVYMYSALSPGFGIDYGAVSSTNPSTYSADGLIAKPVGSGYGFDLSASVRMLGMLRFSAAVNNIGSVTYKRNVYSVRDTLVGEVSLNGLEDYNITNSMKQLLSDGGLLTLEGEEKFTVKNPANFRLGAQVDIGKFASFGIDVVAPFNKDNPGSLQGYVWAFGGDINVVKWLTISVGYLGGGIYKHNIPLGINFVLGQGTYEFGISSRDALTFFLDGSNSISTAFGFARVRF